MNVEQSLRALAAEDRSTAVPAHVDAAVMAAWDAHRLESRQRARTRIVWTMVGTTLAGACAAGLVVLAGTPWGGRGAGSGGPESAPVVARTQQMTSALAEPAIEATAARRSDMRVAASAHRRTTILEPELPEYVLVPDAPLDSPLTMIRVRMERRTFARLGVPIANPDGDGMVDVEMLVGEDGVARSIRRATAVVTAGSGLQ